MISSSGGGWTPLGITGEWPAAESSCTAVSGWHRHPTQKRSGAFAEDLPTRRPASPGHALTALAALTALSTGEACGIIQLTLT